MRLKIIDQKKLKDEEDDIGWYDDETETVHVASKLDMLHVLARDPFVKDPIEELKVLLPKVHLFQFATAMH